MNTPLITWACIVALLVIVVVARMLLGGKAGHRHTHIIEIGSEREEFFVPGDPIPQDIDDYENDYGGNS